MNGIILTAIALASTTAVNSTDYKTAFEKADTTGRPMVVLVGAKWCPGCVVMKDQTIPSLKRNGKLDNVTFVNIDYDNQPALAEKLMRGQSIPQLLIFRKTDAGWKRSQMVGALSEDEAANFISKAVKKQEVALETTTEKK